VDSDLDTLTDTEICAAIRYLEPQVSAPNDDAVATVIGVATVLVLAGLELIWIYRG
jgi:hypothetical protein